MSIQTGLISEKFAPRKMLYGVLPLICDVAVILRLLGDYPLEVSASGEALFNT